MDDEELFFDIWFALHRKRSWHAKGFAKDRGPEPSVEYMMGLRAWMWEGWKARASLHVSGSKRSTDRETDAHD